MTTEVFRVTVQVVHSAPDLDTLTSESTLRSVADAASVAAQNIKNLIENSIADGRVCSLVISSGDDDA